MIIGIPKEIKPSEGRVAVTPRGVGELVRAGHKIKVQKNAAEVLAITHKEFSDEEYTRYGATIVPTAEEVWDSQLVVKVKEPIESEYKLLNGQMLFTFLHLAANKALTNILLEKDVTAIAYETIELPSGELPLLKPMSEIAGRLSIQLGTKYLEASGIFGVEKGKLIGGATGVAPANVVILGGGVVGTNAAKMALGLGAKVTVFDINTNRLEYLDNLFDGKLTTLYAHPEDIHKHVVQADIIIGAVLIKGAEAPKIVTHSDILHMKAGTIIVDVAIDQGGCVSTAKPTTYSYPAYIKYEVIHCCITNMPGIVPYTSTLALTNVTLPYIKALSKGLASAIVNIPGFKKGINIMNGNIVCKAVAETMEEKKKEDLVLIKTK